MHHQAAIGHKKTRLVCQTATFVRARREKRVPDLNNTHESVWRLPGAPPRSCQRQTERRHRQAGAALAALPLRGHQDAGGPIRTGASAGFKV